MRFAPAALCALLLLPLQPVGAQQDLRERFGTRSLEAAEKIGKAIELQNAKKSKEALALLQEAIKVDPKCQMAYFQRALVQGDLGEVDEAMESYKTTLSPGINKSRSLAATAAVNLALTLTKLDRHEEAQVYFTRAIMEDHTGDLKQRGKAYRNLAITLRARGQHMAAAMSLALAYQDRAPNINAKMLNDYFEKADDQEYGVLMTFGRKVPKLAKREHKASLTEVKVEDGPAEKVHELWPDPRGRYVIATVAGAEHYYVISTADAVKVTKVAAPAKVTATALSAGSLYVLTATDPVRIDRLDPLTGKAQASTKIQGATGKMESLAMLPSRNAAIVGIDDTVHIIGLTHGKLTKTNIPGQYVAVHPDQSCIYSYVKPRRGGNSSYIIINGRMMYLRREFDWAQATLYQSVLTPTGLLPMAVRENVSSNPQRMSVSPDGKFVAIAGGGGYRPRDKKPDQNGYGVAVFAADDLSSRVGFFKTDPYPNGVCFNPVTGQVVGIRGDEARVYHTSDPSKSENIKGKFNGLGAFSGDGRYLVLATADKGVVVYENSLADAEKKLAATWYKALEVTVAKVADTTPEAKFEAVAGLDKFEPKALSRAEVSKLFATATKTGRTTLIGKWQDYKEYTKDGAAHKAAVEAAGLATQSADTGIAIYKIRNHIKKHATHVPLQYFLAEVLRRGDQADKSREQYLSVIRADQGRTELTVGALAGLAEVLSADKKPAEALHCAGTALSLDRARPATIALARKLLTAEKYEAEAKALAALDSGKIAITGKLPPLPRAAASDKKLDSKQLFKLASKSVVIVQTGDGSGSGVCVAKSNIIVTNEHVVGNAESVTVIPFEVKGKEVSRLPKLTARVIYRSAKEDVAVLELEKGELTPMAVATEDVESGSKVFAVGHPGLGEKVLDLSISEGLISSTKREVGDTVMLQHSAAVNPGNSGGPLLDEHGRVVGIVTRKARLENVSFAVRVKTLREIFPAE